MKDRDSITTVNMYPYLSEQCDRMITAVGTPTKHSLE